MEQSVQFLGDTIKYLYKPVFQNGRVFNNPNDMTGFSLALSDILIRIYALDPENYAVNEAHVKEEFEKLSLAGLTAAERMSDMMAALRRLTQTVEDLEAQMAAQKAKQPVHVIQEEPDIEELLA
jgi:hypothetical protein